MSSDQKILPDQKSDHAFGTSGTNGEKGNTKPFPSKKTVKKHRRWVFTYNNYSGTEIQKFQTLGGKYIFQEETGEMGTKHLQGYIEFTNARHFGGLKEEVPGAHWEPCKDHKAAMTYCSKEETRTGQVYHNIPLPRDTKVRDPMDGKTPNEMQKKIIELVQSEPDDRSIYVVHDEKGNSGKTTVAKHLVLKYGAIVVSGKANDVKCAVAKMCAEDNPPRIIVWNIPRTANLEYLNYQVIEELKDGMCFSGKYESGMIVMNPPHIIIFTNQMIYQEALTMDRWKFI